jgi:hypothetical protein
MVLRARRLRKPVTHRTRVRSRARVPSHRAPCLRPRGTCARVATRRRDRIRRSREDTPAHPDDDDARAHDRTDSHDRHAAKVRAKRDANRGAARPRARPETEDASPDARTRGRGNRRARRGEASDRARERTRGLTRRDGDE